MEHRKITTMITERQTEQGLRILDIETPLCTASICLQGAHIMSWKPSGEDECFFMSAKSTPTPGKALRGGIPICWPWFGAKEGAPSHGIARTSVWSIHHQEEDAKGNLLLSLALYPENGSLPAAILRITLGSSLIMKLETTARSAPCKLSEAFHNYFAISNLTKCRVFGLEDASFKEHAAKPMKHGENPLAPLGGLDRVYTCPKNAGKVILEDSKMNRAIVIERKYAHSTVVWNPGQLGAEALTDLGGEVWNKFLCIETANAAPKIISLAPGQTHTLYQKISIKKLD